jgi:hypothetical protein
LPEKVVTGVLVREQNLALSMTVGSLGPSACLLIWSFYKVVAAKRLDFFCCKICIKNALSKTPY